MVASNPVTGDSRVQKVAWSAAAAGWDVVVVATSPDGDRHDERLGTGPAAARVVRVPVPQRWAAAARRLAPPALPLAAAADRAAAGVRRRLQVRATAPGSAGGAAGRLAWQLATLRRTLPHQRDLERALLPEVVAARPVLVHAHDYTTLPLAVAAADALADAGRRRPAVVYDAHEYLPGVQAPDPVWRTLLSAGERDGIARADAVVTVSEPLAELLQREHHLPRRPAVVENAPVAAPTDAPAGGAGAPDAGGVRGLREALGLEPDVPLLVYSGAVAPQRGLGTCVDALPELPGVHLALVAAPGNRHVPGLLQRAADLGVGDRVHVHPYVPAAQVPSFLASADIGLVPLLHHPNHELALITKYYEYLHARLPVVVSDVREMARATRELGNGEVFPAGDAGALAAAVRTVLAQRDRYAAAYTPEVLAAHTWGPQAAVLLAEYERLTGGPPPAPAGEPEAFADVRLVPGHGPGTPGPVVLRAPSTRGDRQRS